MVTKSVDVNVLVAMSGGVDSSVAAAMAAQTYGSKNVWGVHMLLNADQEEQCDIKSRTCCGTQDAKDALAVAQQLGIMFDAIPMYEEFQEAVIQNFVDEYAAGRTPVPCTHCNGVLKFDLLLKYADMVGHEYVATGHYVGQREDGRLWMAPHAAKDQTYFLWPIKAQVLERLKFPVGALQKQDTRNLALEWGLAVASKRESMDICFVPRGDYREKLQELRPDLFTPREGSVWQTATDLGVPKPVGRHQGYWNYTIGQRYRAPGMHEKLYVTKIIPASNQIEIGAKSETQRDGFTVRECNWHGQPPVDEPMFVKTRAGAALALAHVRMITEEVYEVFVESMVNATPGQSAVFYTEDPKNPGKILLEGGGWIS